MKTIEEVFQEMGLAHELIVSSAMELYVPHPGVETEAKARRIFSEELRAALSDPNVCVLIYAGVALERAAGLGEIPGLKLETYQRDLTALIADEVLGMAVAQYIGGYKGLFEYIRVDKKKPGIIRKLGPFLDDIIGGLIGGVSANMYTRALIEWEKGKK